MNYMNGNLKNQFTYLFVKCTNVIAFLQVKYLKKLVLNKYYMALYYILYFLLSI